MDNNENISFENILREYESKRTEKKQKQRLKKLANINENGISPFVVKGVEEFKKLINQIKNEIESKRNK
jgi:hypothetical protein